MGKIDDLKNARDRLMREMKKEKSDEYKEGCADGILDMYNDAERILTTEPEQKQTAEVANEV